MASTLTYTLLVSYSILLSTFFITISTENSETFAETVLMDQSEKVSHLQFYFHDIVSGKTPTAIQIAGSTKPVSGTPFGMTFMADDLLTEGPEADSKIIGRAQGIYAVASQQEIGLLMVLNYVFTQGKYNGSTLSVLGRNPILHEVREMPVVGGSGLFRFARGYALAHTVFANSQGDAIVQYNVTVMHY